MLLLVHINIIFLHISFIIFIQESIFLHIRILFLGQNIRPEKEIEYYVGT